MDVDHERKRPYGRFFYLWPMPLDNYQKVEQMLLASSEITTTSINRDGDELHVTYTLNNVDLSIIFSGEEVDRIAQNYAGQ